MSSSESKLIYWAPKTAFSAQFYSAGKSVSTLDPKELRQLLSNNVDDYVVVKIEYVKSIPNDVLVQLTEVTTISMLKGQFVLFRRAPDTYL